MHVQTQQPSANQQKHQKPVKNFVTTLTVVTPNQKNNTQNTAIKNSTKFTHFSFL